MVLKNKLFCGVNMRFVALLCGLLFVGPACASDPALELADLIGGKAHYNQLSHQVLGEMIRKQPALVRYQPVIQKWAREYLTWERMRAELAQTYHSHFTTAEINQMLQFFSTPTGQKYIRYAPLMQEEMALIGRRLAREQQPRLILMLQQAGADVQRAPAPQPTAR